MQTTMELEPIPILRNESTSSTTSTESDDSVLHTPSDEHALDFELIDGALLAATTPKGLIDFEYHGVASHRVSFPRQFSKAIVDVKSNAEVKAASQHSPRSEPESYYPDSPPVPNSSPEIDCSSGVMTPNQPEENVIQEARPRTPDSILNFYTTAVNQDVVRTPRSRPGLLRSDIFSPAQPPVPFFLNEVESIEFTPRAHSTLRHRRVQLDQSNVEKLSPTSPFLNHNDDLDQSSLHVPSFTQVSVLLPLQFVAFPVYAAFVGAVILLAPDNLSNIAFPATVTTVPQSNAGHLFRAILSLIFPFSSPSPPTQPIREFAHWVSVAHLHVAIFLSVLAGLAYLHLPLGILVAAGCLARIVQPGAWGHFSLPEEDEEEELGADVREMLWRAVVAAPGSGLRDGENVKNVGGRFYVVRKAKSDTRADVLAAGGLDSTEDAEDDDD
ncbi:Protoporphyrinogen oxidase [Mycena indigotica]|uniref:Protoporphyrinogen oxidase n=1 Tax=Mycena indigotica TaxID=2126181 RepID=A0A8H6VR74_9AGAR|nr:Protoporphyrinogen oxidase [Mycena indigotica]KAF7290759.1 Protoporphyrinogen oxidase [Mycena indigotica]